MFTIRSKELTWWVEGKPAAYDSIIVREICYSSFPRQRREEFSPKRLLASGKSEKKNLRYQIYSAVSISECSKLFWEYLYMANGIYWNVMWTVPMTIPQKPHTDSPRLVKPIDNCFRDFQVEYICRDKNIKCHISLKITCPESWRWVYNFCTATAASSAGETTRN